VEPDKSAREPNRSQNFTILNFRGPCHFCTFWNSPLSIRGKSGPGSSVGIATGYGLDGPEIESRFGRGFLHLSRPALGLTQPPVQWVPGLSRGERRPGRGADPSHSHLVPKVLEKSRAMPLLTLRAFVAYKKGVTYLPVLGKMNFSLTLWQRYKVPEV